MAHLFFARLVLSSTKKGRTASARRSGLSLDQDLSGLSQGDIAGIIAEESLDESSVAPSAGGEEPVAASVGAKKSARAKSAGRVAEEPAAHAQDAGQENDVLAPSNAFVRFFSLCWFLFSSVFVYLYQLLAMAGNGVVKFGHYAVRRSVRGFSIPLLFRLPKRQSFRLLIDVRSECPKQV